MLDGTFKLKDKKARKQTWRYPSRWAGRTRGRWGMRTACRGWWRSRWSKAGGGAGGSDKWCPGKAYPDSRRNKPSVSSSCNPSSPILHSPWSYWDLACRCPANRGTRNNNPPWKRPPNWVMWSHYRVDDDQVAVVRPRSEFHAAVLQVERKVKDHDLTVALEDGRRSPRYHTRVLQQDLCLVNDGEVSVGTVNMDAVLDTCTFKKNSPTQTDRHTCCRELSRVSRCLWRESWSFWCRRNHQDSTADSHPSIAEYEKEWKNMHIRLLTPMHWWFSKWVQWISKTEMNRNDSWTPHLLQPNITGDNLIHFILLIHEQRHDIRRWTSRKRRE